MRLFVLLPALLLTLALPACDSGDDAPPPVIPIEDAEFAASLNVNLAASTRTANGVYYRDLVEGTSAPITTGKTASVRYKGWLSDGTLFEDASGTTTPGLTFVLGGNQVIDGWDEGLVGMRIGGTRQLIIPPDLAYGPNGTGAIPGNAILVFEVKLVSFY